MSGCDKGSMQSLLTLLTQWSLKAWVAVIVAVFSCGTATVFYFSSANAGSNSAPGIPTVALKAVHAGHPGGTLGPERCTAPLPVVPEADAGLALIPVMAAMLLFSARRLWLRPTATADGQNAKGAS